MANRKKEKKPQYTTGASPCFQGGNYYAWVHGSKNPLSEKDAKSLARVQLQVQRAAVRFWDAKTQAMLGGPTEAVERAEKLLLMYTARLILLEVEESS